MAKSIKCPKCGRAMEAGPKWIGATVYYCHSVGVCNVHSIVITWQDGKQP